MAAAPHWPRRLPTHPPLTLCARPAPLVLQASVLEKCGFQPRGTETQVYSIQDSQLCLTGTAEVPLGGVYMDKVRPHHIDSRPFAGSCCAYVWSHLALWKPRGRL
jgi:hypothetical protein